MSIVTASSGSGYHTVVRHILLCAVNVKTPCDSVIPTLHLGQLLYVHVFAYWNKLSFATDGKICK